MILTPAALLARLSPLLGRLLVPGLVLAMIGAAVWYLQREGRQDCEADARISEQQGQIQNLQWLGEYADFNAQLAGDYILRRGQAELLYRTLYSEVPHVTSTYIPAPGALPQPLPACVFTHGFVGVWNRALEAGGNVPASEPGATQAAAGSSAVASESSAALHDAGVTQKEVLENHLANSQVNHDVRLQCERLIAFHTQGPEAPSR